MCITEEEFREQRKEAIAVLEELKALEATYEMEQERVDAKTLCARRKNHEARATTRKKYRHVLPSERALEDFLIDHLFDNEADEVIYIY